MKNFSVMVIFILLTTPVSADRLNLKSGASFEGDIVEKTDSYVRINVQGEIQTYNWAEIKSITRRIVEETEPAVSDVSRPDPVEESALNPGSDPVQPADKADTITSNFEPPGFNGIQWGASPAGFPFLKYVFTDPATGVNIYINTDDKSENGRDWKDRTQYHFWNDQFFKMTHSIFNKKAWEYLKNSYIQQYGEQERNAENPNIYIWEGTEAMVAVNFDDDYQEGSFIMASQKLSETINAQDSTALSSLLAALQDADNDVRTRAVLNLGVMKNPKATLVLIPLLRDENFIVRYNTAYALGEIKDERAVQSLIEALLDEDDFVRSFAAEALGKIGSERAVKPLIEALTDNSAASDALKEITGQNFGKDQQRWRNWWHSRFPNKI